ncbi:MAG: PAS domain-containing sensor histidine kinase [Betaproteobacteria bacterium]|nr:PAS domain-containing sensor histidine kinase [Betaproteobacteria bacterium]
MLDAAIEYARSNHCSYTEHDLRIGALGHGKLHLSCTVSPVELEGWVGRSANGSQGRADSLVAKNPHPHPSLPLEGEGESSRIAGSQAPPVCGKRATAPAPANGRSANGSQGLLLEFRHIEQQLRIAREERLLDQSQADRELIRNLAHEIKNPLGGIRGAAQLLDHELERPALHEYTQVIMKEADRLQSLMDRLLTPHRLPQLASLNIHEVLERVRSLILAEYPQGITIGRDYDTSVPLLTGDKEQMIQVVLNVVRNAAQAMHGSGEITLRSRVARQVTLARKRYRHALELQISDTGPGIPEDMRERIFYPLVSGREGGSGLGLTLAQTFVTQHGGTITFESQPGHTTFTLLLPIEGTGI